MQGLFQAATLVKQKTFAESARCGSCGLFKTCQLPKLPPVGRGGSGILIVMPQVTRIDDKESLFSGALASEVRKLLLAHSLSPTTDCTITAATICYGRNPTPQQIDDCSFKLRQTIEDTKPTLVILIGHEAIRNGIQFMWNREAEDPRRWNGYHIPCQYGNMWVCPVLEPTFSEKDCSELLFKRQFSEALERRFSRPWKTVPDFKSEVKLLEEKDGIKFLKQIIKHGGPTAWDYETNSLKPEHDRAEVLTISFCWLGRYTAAFPWTERVSGHVADFCRAENVPKIASNLQFEHRWTRAILGIDTVNWMWDTMQSAHCLDNRKGVSSIKFQSFVKLGFPEYDGHIHQFLITGEEKSEDTHAVNRAVLDIPLKDLLVYNALDSLLEYKVAKIQMKQMNHPLYKAIKNA